MKKDRLDNYLDLSHVENNSEYIKLEAAANTIRNGGLVLFPTETVYGLGADGLNPDAVRKIYEAKGRKSDNPLILHISNIEMLGRIAKNITDVEFKLMNAFWPGPFTIILNKTDIVPDIVSAGLDTVGIRMPSNEIAQNLIKFADTPIAAPSANISGRPSGTNIDDIYQEFADKVDYFVDGGECNIGVESTVVRVINDVPHILRPGKITAEDIKNVAGNVVIDKNILGKLTPSEKVLSPGMKYKHYAPATNCMLVYNEDNSLIRESILNIIADCKNNSKKTLIMCLDENAKYFCDKLNNDIPIINLGKNLEEVSKNIFTDLRKADTYDVDLIIIQGVKSDGLGLAIMNRLLRACNYNIYK